MSISRRTSSLGRTDYFTVAAGWLPGEPVIGECFVDEARGTEVISFEYDRKWVAVHPDLLFIAKDDELGHILQDAALDRFRRK